MGFLKIDEQLLVVGSAAGAPRHPDWYRNVLAHPEVEVELGAETFSAVAIPAEGAERDRLFDEIARREPDFAEYQATTTCTLPVVALQRESYEPDFEVTTMADKLVEVHMWIRAQLRRVRIEADAYFAGQSSAGLSLRIRQYCLAFCTSLHLHHFGEDAVMFPSLEAEYPELRESIQRLREEHRTVERIRGELEVVIAGISNANAVRFLAGLDRMTKELEAHLDFEEEAVIPAMAKIPFPPRAGE